MSVSRNTRRSLLSTFLAGVVAKLIAPAEAAQKNPAATGTNRIMHTVIRVNDLDKCLKFYVDALGMHEKRRRAAGDDIECVIGYTDEFLRAEIMLIYNQAKSGLARANVWTGSKAVNDMGSRMILEAKDLKNTLSKVEKAGGKVRMTPTKFPPEVVRAVGVVEDPEGNPYEIVHII